MFHYDVFVENLQHLPEGAEVNLAVRDLSPGLEKYCYSNVKAMVSSDPEKFEHKLQVRFGRGQTHSDPYSIKILEKINRIPERWR